MNPIARFLIFFFLLDLVFFMNLAEPKCPKSFDCDSLGPLEFPLTDYLEPDCGLFLVDCTSSTPRIQFQHGGGWYSVLKNLSTSTFEVQDDTLTDLLGKKDCRAFESSNMPDSRFSSFTIFPTTNIFLCGNFLHSSDAEQIQEYFKHFRNYTRCDAFTVYYGNRYENLPPNIREKCLVVQLHVRSRPESVDLFQQISSTFNIEWKIYPECLSCHNRGKKCITNKDSRFRCEGNRIFKKKFFLIGGVSLTGVISTSILLCILIRRQYTLLKLLSLQKAEPESQKDIQLFLKNHGNLAQKSFKYSDLKKMTNSFSENLGNGGYGSVYKGKLPDGRLVAVKILNESKGNGEDFINEVASISRTSHINIVTLVGFCFQGSKRALVYDFMPNGSLDKFIQNPVEWQKLFEIAVGIARGLEYLHRGCNTRILHFDIKPHNILLDKDLNPKISDFGLAKLCPNRSSIVSMLVARGTIGYIAPEVFCRNFGEVSHKSDVYSYGMMILEIAGGKKNIDPDS